MGERRKGQRERERRALDNSELLILCENVEVTKKKPGKDPWERVRESCERVTKKEEGKNKLRMCLMRHDLKLLTKAWMQEKKKAEKEKIIICAISVKAHLIHSLVLYFRVPTYSRHASRYVVVPSIPHQSFHSSQASRSDAHASRQA